MEIKVRVFINKKKTMAGTVGSFDLVLAVLALGYVAHPDVVLTFEMN